MIGLWPIKNVMEIQKTPTIQERTQNSFWHRLAVSMLFKTWWKVNFKSDVRFWRKISKVACSERRWGGKEELCCLQGGAKRGVAYLLLLAAYPEVAQVDRVVRRRARVRCLRGAQTLHLVHHLGAKMMRMMLMVSRIRCILNMIWVRAQPNTNIFPNHGENNLNTWPKISILYIF